MLRPGGGAPTPSGLLQPVAVAVHRQDADVVGEPVEQRTGQPLAAQHLGPVLERQVGGDDRGATLVSLGEHLEQQLGARG